MSEKSFNLFKGQLLGDKLFLTYEALAIAEDAHKGVFRNDKITPYIEHPVKVASMLYNMGIKDEIILSSAILHDVLEDTQVDGIDIINKFKKLCEDRYDDFKVNQIIKVVKLVSKKEGYVPQEYYNAIQDNAFALLIKLADRTHNLSTFSVFKEHRKARYVCETEKYFYPMIRYAQHNYATWSNQWRLFELMLQMVIDNVKPYLTEEIEKYELSLQGETECIGLQ